MLNASSFVLFPFSGSEFLRTPTDRFQPVCGPHLRQSCRSTRRPFLSHRESPRKSEIVLLSSPRSSRHLQSEERSLRPALLPVSLYRLGIFDRLYKRGLSLP